MDANAESDFLTSRELAAKINMSVKYVEKYRRRIAGACRFGRAWRFNRFAVEKALSTGRLVTE